MQRFSKPFGRLLVLVALLALGRPVTAQMVSLQDLSAFNNPNSNWRIVGAVQADLSQANVLTAKPGTGILANLPAEKKYGMEFDLFTKIEHGDADISFEFMMAKGSNSGVYLQGRYEIQLYDSWGKPYPTLQDCGGIYERWNDQKPEGQKGFEGTAPRMNVTRAPGLWQTMKISFRAPRFDAQGKKIANARIIRVEQNGVVLHENIELTGPTRGPMAENEVAKGPIRIQGDHGPVAFRNLVIQTYDSPAPTFPTLNYTLAEKLITLEKDLTGLAVTKRGKAETINNGATSLSNGYVLTHSGTIRLAEAGRYRFQGIFEGGHARLRINNKDVIGWSEWGNTAEVELPAGDLPFEYVYAKNTEWARPSLGLFIEGPGVRFMPLHGLGSLKLSNPENPVYLNEGREAVIHRSFLTFGKSKVPHGISVGDPTRMHYSMDLANGSLLRVWKGDFLNVTPMWNDRGNGTSLPLGSVLELSDNAIILEVNGTKADAYRPRGYSVDALNRPTFHYDWNGLRFDDQLLPDTEAKYLVRTLKVPTEQATFSLKAASGETIELIDKETFRINGTYYIRLQKAQKASIENDTDGRKSLVLSGQGTLSYGLVW